MSTAEAEIELQGVQRLSARSSAPSVQGVRWVWTSEHGRQRYSCKECGGSGICEHGRQRYSCKECGGSGIREHGRIRCKCKECGGSKSASTVVYALSARGGVSAFCEHGRERSKCKECGGSGICEHGRQRSSCKEWWVSNLRARSSAPQCKECGGSGSAARCVALSARNAVVHHSASTVVALSAECGGSGICQHGRVRSHCKEWWGLNLRARPPAL